ncbi:MAG: glycosyltransferase [Clostridia bacterium]|nr:glycosyltransferase [Clostridia bacterium]
MRKSKIRIVHTCPLGTGGITSLVLNLCEHIDRDKVNFDYLVYRDEKEYNEERATALGGKKLVASNTDAKNSAMKFWLKFYRSYKIFKKEKPDAFHINASTPYDTLIGIAAKAAGVKKVIIHSHNASSSGNSKIKKLIYEFTKLVMSLYTDEYFTCSTEAAEYMFPKSVLKKKNYAMIKNGIMPDKFIFDSKKRDELRNKYNLTDAFVIGNIGRMETQKNQTFLLDVVKELTKINPKAVLVLIGIGTLEAKLKEKAKTLGIENNVIFWGASKNVNELMMMMDMFVMTSFHEGLPVVGIEAQTTGLPCVFADTITKEVKISENVEFISLKESAAGWANEILKLAEKENNRTKGVENAENSGFTIEAVAKDLEQRYIDICK